MSEVIEVLDNEDMPCNDWIGSPAEVKECPMKCKWHEGEVRMCFEFGWKIGYNIDKDE